MEKESLAHSSPLTALTRNTARKFGEKLFLFLDSLPLYSEHVTLELLSILDSFVLYNPQKMLTNSFLSVLEYVSGDAVAHIAATDAVSAGSHCSYGSANCPKTCGACPTTKPSDPLPASVSPEPDNKTVCFSCLYFCLSLASLSLSCPLMTFFPLSFLLLWLWLCDEMPLQFATFRVLFLSLYSQSN